MKYLTIDTTTKVTALALAENGLLVGESFLHTAKTHSERLIPMLDQLLNAADWTLKDLDFIGVVRGPGSFTGIRIGIATAQGLSQVLKVPLVGVLSLDALSWAGYGRSEELAVILDARKNEWYSARYKWIKNQDEGYYREYIAKPAAVEPARLLAELKKDDKPVLFAGDAVLRAREYIEGSLEEKAVILPEYQCLPRGAYTAYEVWEVRKRILSGELNRQENVEPYYIRLSEAEVNYLKREKERKQKEAHRPGSN